MIHRHRPGRRALASSLAAFALAIATTSPLQAASSLSGYAYIDRNNDGQLAFADAAQPEWVLSGVEVKLYSMSGSTETLLSTTTTSSIGEYLFSGLSAGTYAIRQTQPVGYLDGIDTLGIIRNLNNNQVPAGANVGSVAADAFLNIALPADSRGNFYNFGERGLLPGHVSKRYLLGTAPPIVTAPDPEPASSVPEPSTAALLALGWFGLTAARRRSAR
ncbi:SdrD B-like domain-containing protein [Lacipirellula limnantheis]|uniref:Serine-aspartate repeat-containing protein C n=1 Tax=Lacipirellula limnantheis TaxID=2528024 RepID=A0A517TXA0_9BACT|nr:SdrD B-like domain-containing protein [Lacipirellula limnantheis]QDT73000.1 Serine-aspartate repeat-containing protein C precursor [Lacipirellula limnantheis]